MYPYRFKRSFPKQPILFSFSQLPLTPLFFPVQIIFVDSMYYWWTVFFRWQRFNMRWAPVPLTASSRLDNFVDVYIVSILWSFGTLSMYINIPNSSIADCVRGSAWTPSNIIFVPLLHFYTWNNSILSWFSFFKRYSLDVDIKAWKGERPEGYDPLDSVYVFWGVLFV